MLLLSGVQSFYCIDDVQLTGHLEASASVTEQCYHTSTSRGVQWINLYKIQGPAFQVVSLDYVNRFIISSIPGSQGKTAISLASCHQKVGLVSHWTLWGMEKWRGLLWNATCSSMLTNSQISFLWGKPKPAGCVESCPTTCGMTPLSYMSLWVMILLIGAAGKERQAHPEVYLVSWTISHSDMATRYTSFEKHLLPCYWALVKTEHVTLGGPMTIRVEESSIPSSVAFLLLYMRSVTYPSGKTLSPFPLPESKSLSPLSSQRVP